jgi:hypothetical protein
MVLSPMVFRTKNHIADKGQEQFSSEPVITEQSTDIIHSVMSLIVILIFITMRTSKVTPRWLYGPNYYICPEITHLLLIELSNTCDRLECWSNEWQQSVLRVKLSFLKQIVLHIFYMLKHSWRISVQFPLLFFM